MSATATDQASTKTPVNRTNMVHLLDEARSKNGVLFALCGFRCSRERPLSDPLDCLVCAEIATGMGGEAA